MDDYAPSTSSQPVRRLHGLRLTGWHARQVGRARRDLFHVVVFGPEAMRNTAFAPRRRDDQDTPAILTDWQSRVVNGIGQKRAFLIDKDAAVFDTMTARGFAVLPRRNADDL